MKDVRYILLLATLILVSACGGGDDPGDEPNVSKDFINVTPNVEILGDGQTTDITISSNCNWTITKDADWISITPSSGNGTQSVSLTAGKNSSGSPRVAVLTVKGGTAPVRTITVTQSISSDTSEETKSLTVSESSMSFTASRESKTFTIRSNTSWTITKPEWCTLSESSGSGDATITVIVGENTEQAQRVGTIVVSGVGVSSISISVTQSAQSSNPYGEPNAGDNLPPS